MKLLGCLCLSVVSLTGTLACSSSSTSGTTPDASAPDSHVAQQDSGTAIDSSTAVDSGAAADTSTSADTSVTPEDSSAPVDSGPVDAGSDAATLSFNTDIYGAIITHHCIFCHGPTADGGEGSGEAFGKLDMSSVDAGYANLVGVAAAGGACGGDAGLVRVVAGNAAASLVWMKVNGYTTAPPCGSPMPKSGEIPDGGQAVVADQIQTWINQGANP
jgi:mono/diheme cytochrome c family protein